MIKKKTVLIPALVVALCGSILMLGCSGKKQGVSLCDTGAVQTFSLDTTVCAVEGMASPSCELKLDLAFLSSESDSVSVRMNRAIMEKAFGMKVDASTPVEFLRALSDSFISEYRADVAELLKEDLKSGVAQGDLPGWYNYAYCLSSALTVGMSDSIWNYVLTDFRQTGGAHPNTIATYLNIDATTGEVLTKKDVFLPEADEALTPDIIKELHKKACGLCPDDEIPPTIDGLHKAGILEGASPYIPENFRLGKDSVTFYYNRYEIACYAAGDFEVKLPLDKVRKYLIRK